MPIEYLGLSSINGPLIAMEGIQNAFYDEIVEFVGNWLEKAHLKVENMLKNYTGKFF